MNIEQTKDDDDGDYMEGEDDLDAKDDQSPKSFVEKPNPTSVSLLWKVLSRRWLKCFPLSLTFSFLRQNKRGSIGAN